MKNNKVSAEKQLLNMEMVGFLMDAGLGERILSIIEASVKNAHDTSKMATIETAKSWGVREEFDTYFPIFVEINKRNIDMKDVMGSLNLNLTKALESSETFGDIVASLVKQGANEKAITIMNSMLGYGNDELNRILRGVEEYNEREAELKSIQSENASMRSALSMYRDAYEIYKKILYEIYFKAKKTRKRDDNLFHKFFKEEFPALRKNFNNKLRNDEAHLVYDTRDSFSPEDIVKHSKLLLIRSMTAVVAKHEVITGLFTDSLAFIKNSWDKKLKRA